MDKKKRIINLINQAYQFEQTFLRTLTDEQKSSPGSLENWSPKDLVAHNASWKERHSKNIAAVQKGGDPVRVTDFDQENERLFKEHNLKSWDEVLEFARNSQDNLIRLVETLSTESLERYGFLPWQEDRTLWRTIWGYGYSHPLVHIAEHYRNRGDTDQAAAVIGILADGMADLDDSPSWRAAIHYNRACQFSLSGEKDDAISELSAALGLDDSFREWAQIDQDLEAIQDEPGYQELFNT